MVEQIPQGTDRRRWAPRGSVWTYRVPMSRIAAISCTLVLLLSACGDDDTVTDAGGSTTTAGDVATTDAGSDATSSTTAAGTSDLPGEPVDIFPYDGATLAVVGVAADDVLNVRARPDVEADIVFTLDPLHTGAVATGNNRQLPGGAIWAEIEDDGRSGWANTAFLLQPGVVTDETAALYPSPSDRPTTDTMAEMARTVAAEVAAEEPESAVTIVDGPTVGDLGEVTVDVIGLGDDSVGGYRLHIFAEPDGGGESFTLRTVESTALCSRGVDDEERCL